MTTHLPAALLPLLLALVQGLLLWALWSLRRSFVPQAEHLRCRRDEQRREALWLRRLDLLEQALAQERELLTPLADEVRSLREDAGRLHSQLQAQEARFYGLERLLQRLERHLERQEDRWQQLPGAALPALLHPGKSPARAPATPDRTSRHCRGLGKKHRHRQRDQGTARPCPHAGAGGHVAGRRPEVPRPPARHLGRTGAGRWPSVTLDGPP